jgi:plasmid stabilization system protein ParE
LIRWTRKAQQDLERLHGFLAAVNPVAAQRVLRALIAAVSHLGEHPRLGARLNEYGKREVRRLVVGDYELRHELKGTALFVLRLWHVREDR